MYMKYIFMNMCGYQLIFKYTEVLGLLVKEKKKQMQTFQLLVIVVIETIKQYNLTVIIPL